MIYTLIFCLFSTLSFAKAAEAQDHAQEQMIIVDSTYLIGLIKKFPELRIMHRQPHTSVLRVPSAGILDQIQHHLHETTHKCGNFTLSEPGLDPAISESKRVEQLMQVEVQRSEQLQSTSQQFNYLAQAGYSITRTSEVNALMSKLNERQIYHTIDQLSQFPTRFFQSHTAEIAARRIFDHWRFLLSKRKDSTVEYYRHSWRQPSVIAKIKGKTNQEIIIGGHLDSINGSYSSYHAPGADDNASGIATISEVMRVLVDQNYQPQHTLTFMAYAAEEVGLRGSRDIAKFYKQQQKSVLGVLQLDMTNFPGSGEKMFLTSDYTNAALTAFLGQLITEYVKIPFAQEKCGYACSDHAAWFEQGMPSANPFEANFQLKQYNQKIHTTQDNVAQSNYSASHSMHFAKLAIAFALELDK
jgi:bacterial leucyl aminopeptidase